MKKTRIVITTLLILPLLFTGCSPKGRKTDNANVITKSSETPTRDPKQLEKKVVTLQRETIKLTEDLDAANDKVDKLQKKLDDLQGGTGTKQGDISVKVLGKREISADDNEDTYQNRIVLQVKVKNNTNKDIKAVKGTLKFKDLFGDKILNLGCNFTGKTIKAHKSVVFDDFAADMNPFMDNENRLYNTSYKELTFSYDTSEVIFTDGTKKNN